MNRRLLIALALSVGVLIAAPSFPAAGQAAPSPGSSTGPLTVVEESQHGRVVDLVLDSPAMGGPVPVRVLLPTEYDDPRRIRDRYPTLYLLHGAGGDQTDWTGGVEDCLSQMCGTNLVDYTADLDLIVVMPYGGDLGFYTDWIDGSANWESHHIDELVDWVDDSYRTVGTREARAIGGLSMGGYGALVYAARHPEMFVTAASFSGVVDIAAGGAAEALILQGMGIADERRWGPYLTHEAFWRGHNPADLALNLQWTGVRVTTANGVPCPGDSPPAAVLEAGTMTMALGFQTRMDQVNASMELEVRPCGSHEWQYWDRDIRAWLPKVIETFASPQSPPPAFDYRSIDPAFSVWGWDVTTIDRPAIEFLELFDVSTAGLTAVGSGTVHFTTPPDYQPRTTYRLAVTSTGATTVPIGHLAPFGEPTGDADVSELIVRAGRRGRLSFSLDLGSPHTANQYSPDGAAAELVSPGEHFRTATITIEPASGRHANPHSTASDVVPGSATALSPSAPDKPSLPSTGSGAPAWVFLLVGAAVGIRLKFLGGR